MLLAPTALGITVFGRAVVRSAVGRVLIFADMLDERIGSMVRSECALGGGVLSCLVMPQSGNSVAARMGPGWMDTVCVESGEDRWEFVLSEVLNDCLGPRVGC